MEKKIKGIFPALVTPFTKDGIIDTNQLEKIVEFEVTKLDIDGLYVCGSTGEAFLLDFNERKLILETVSKVVKNKLKSNIKLIAQVGGLNVFEMIKLAKIAEECGYDAISAVTPFYYGFKFDDIKNYYQFLIDNSNLPIIIYYLPALTSINISMNDFIELLGMKNVIGVKYSSPDLFMLERLIQAKPDSTFLFGVDEFLMSASTLGIDGAIGSTFNIMGHLAKKIFLSTKSSNVFEAKNLTQKYNTYLKHILDNGVYQVIKQSVAYASGAGETYCRMPMKQICDKSRISSKELLNIIFGK